MSGDLKRILEAAAAAASQGKRREINGAIVLAAIVGEGRSTSAHMLRAQGMTFEEAIKALQRSQLAAAQATRRDAPGTAKRRRYSGRRPRARANADAAGQPRRAAAGSCRTPDE